MVLDLWDARLAGVGALGRSCRASSWDRSIARATSVASCPEFKAGSFHGLVCVKGGNALCNKLYNMACEQELWRDCCSLASSSSIMVQQPISRRLHAGL